MESLPALTGVPGTRPVHERQGGSRRQADAFRQALGQHGAPRDARSPGGEPPMRTPLQPRVPAGRKEPEQGLHVDVIA